MVNIEKFYVEILQRYCKIYGIIHYNETMEYERLNVASILTMENLLQISQRKVG